MKKFFPAIVALALTGCVLGACAPQVAAVKADLACTASTFKTWPEDVALPDWYPGQHLHAGEVSSCYR